MAKKISIAKLTTILNDFIGNNDASDLQAFLNDFDLTKIDYKLDSSSLYFDDEDFEIKKPKIEACLEYIAKNNDKLDGNVGKLVYETVMKAADMGKNFALDEETAKKLLKIKAIVPEVIIPKSSKFKAFAKKYIRPAAITSVLAAGSTYAVYKFANELDLGSILGIVTDNAELTAISTATNTGLITLTMTVGTLVAIDKLTRAYYAKTYGVKANNIHKLLHQESTEAEAISELNLPINNLLNIMKETDEKIAQNNESKNLIGKLHNKILLKQNRNRLHALYQFYHLLNEQLVASTSKNNELKLSALAMNIDNYIDNLMEASLMSVYQKQTNSRFRKRFLLDRSDIIAKNTGKKLATELANTAKHRRRTLKKELKQAYSKKGVKSATNNLINQLLMKYLTTGEQSVVPIISELEPIVLDTELEVMPVEFDEPIIETVVEPTAEPIAEPTDEPTAEGEITLTDFLDTPEEIAPFDFAIKDTDTAKVIEDDVAETIEIVTNVNPIIATDEVEATIEDFLTEIEESEDLESKHTQLNKFYNNIAKIDNVSEDWRSSILERIGNDILQTEKEKEEKLNTEQAEKSAKAGKSLTDKTASTKFAEAYILKQIKNCGEETIASMYKIDLIIVKKIKQALEEKSSRNSTVTAGLGRRDPDFKEGFNKLFNVARTNLEGVELDLTIKCSESTIKQVATVITTTGDEFSSIPTEWYFD